MSRLKRIVVSIGRVFRQIVRRSAPCLDSVRKIGVYKAGAIGDVLMTTPFVRALRARFPKARIDYWTGKWSSPVIENNPAIDSVVSFDEKAVVRRNFFAALKLLRMVRQKKYDLFCMLDIDVFANLFAAMSNSGLTAGFDRNGEGFPLSITAHYGRRQSDIKSYLGIAAALGANQKDEKPALFLTAKEKCFANAFFRRHKLIPSRTVAIAAGGAKNPGMTLEFKRWPAERFAAVAEWLVQKGRQVLLIGGSGDTGASKKVRARVPQAVDATGKTSLRGSAALLSLCSRLVCNDSGPMHVAAALGIPVTAVFGPTDPVKLAPFGKEHRILWKHPGKKPCYLDGRLFSCPDNHECIRRVGVRDVLEVLQ
jgi:heptosyltransferase-2